MALLTLTRIVIITVALFAIHQSVQEHRPSANSSIWLL
jgi:hypothetical protein